MRPLRPAPLLARLLLGLSLVTAPLRAAQAEDVAPPRPPSSQPVVSPSPPEPWPIGRGPALPPRRSTPAMIAGLVTLGVGTSAILGGLGTIQMSRVCALGGTCTREPDVYAVGVGLLVAGVLHLFVGIPVTVNGASRETPSLVGAPAANGWMWRF